MPAYNFQARFAPAIESGDKRQTIRAKGKRRHARPGEKVYLYTGMRTKACRKLGEAVCSSVDGITIYKDMVFTHSEPRKIYRGKSLEGVAHADGFASWPEMRDWFAKVHGLPFIGILIRWR